MKKLLCLLMALLTPLFIFVSCDEEDVTNETEQERIAPKYEEIDRTTISSLDGVELSDTPTDYVLIDVKDYGKIVIRLFPDVAPTTVTNFKKLVSESFYDGLIFHRVIDNFMIQGGDPDGDGSGGSKDTIFGEFESNGFENNLRHTKGVLSMARLGNDMNSASSQFFICHKTSGVKHLDGDYASFGYVIYGMDVVDEIADVKVNSSDKPLTDVVISSIRFVTVTEVESSNTDTNTDTSAT